MILLDTQALVWLIEGSSRLGPQAAAIEAASEKVVISAISLWEIGYLVSRDRLTLSLPMQYWTDRVEFEAGIDINPVSRSIAIDAGLLPDYNHGDPEDRVVLATARGLSCPVVTSDKRMLAYAKAGHVQAIDARR